MWRALLNDARNRKMYQKIQTDANLIDVKHYVMLPSLSDNFQQKSSGAAGDVSILPIVTGVRRIELGTEKRNRRQKRAPR